MAYSDLLGNSFNQNLKFEVIYHLGHTIDDKYINECDIHLIEIGIPEKGSKR